MPSEATNPTDSELVQKLKDLDVRGVLMQMAKNGQLHSMKCEMPSCYCPHGRGHFVPNAHPTDDWRPTADHYPKLKADGGDRSPGNIRLAHRLCNRADWGWRKEIRMMLNANRSLKEIADNLNEKGVKRPHGISKWTPAAVRKAYVS